MSKFLLLLHEDPNNFATASAEEMQAIVGEYIAWREALMADGFLVGGEKLMDEGGKSLHRENAELQVVDGPYSEAKEVLGGFFLIQADHYDQAIEISRSCPHLKYDGRITLRQIDETHD